MENHEIEEFEKFEKLIISSNFKKLVSYLNSGKEIDCDVYDYHKKKVKISNKSFSFVMIENTNAYWRSAFETLEISYDNIEDFITYQVVKYSYCYNETREQIEATQRVENRNNNSVYYSKKDVDNSFSKNSITKVEMLGKFSSVISKLKFE